VISLPAGAASPGFSTLVAGAKRAPDSSERPPPSPPRLCCLPCCAGIPEALTNCYASY